MTCAWRGCKSCWHCVSPPASGWQVGLESTPGGHQFMQPCSQQIAHRRLGCYIELQASSPVRVNPETGCGKLTPDERGVGLNPTCRSRPREAALSATYTVPDMKLGQWPLLLLHPFWQTLFVNLMWSSLPRKVSSERIMQGS
jgi:hypothetical protein